MLSTFIIRVLIVALLAILPLSANASLELRFSDAALAAEAFIKDRFGDKAYLVSLQFERLEGADPVYIARFEPEITTESERQASKYHVVIVSMDRSIKLEMRMDSKARVIRRTLIKPSDPSEE